MGHSHVICMGDFNYPQIDWDSYSTTGTIEDASFLFIECVHDCYWEQHVKEPSRGTNKPSLLDLVEGKVQELDIEAPLGASDHGVIDVIFKCRTDEDPTPPNKVVFQYEKADYMVRWEICWTKTGRSYLGMLVLR